MISFVCKPGKNCHRPAACQIGNLHGEENPTCRRFRGVIREREKKHDRDREREREIEKSVIQSVNCQLKGKGSSLVQGTISMQYTIQIQYKGQYQCNIQYKYNAIRHTPFTPK